MGDPTEGYSQNEDRAYETIWRKLPKLLERIAEAEERQAAALERLADADDELKEVTQ